MQHDRLKKHREADGEARSCANRRRDPGLQGEESGQEGERSWPSCPRPRLCLCARLVGPTSGDRPTSKSLEAYWKQGFGSKSLEAASTGVGGPAGTFTRQPTPCRFAQSHNSLCECVWSAPTTAPEENKDKKASPLSWVAEIEKEKVKKEKKEKKKRMRDSLAAAQQEIKDLQLKLKNMTGYLCHTCGSWNTQPSDEERSTLVTCNECKARHEVCLICRSNRVSMQASAEEYENFEYLECHACGCHVTKGRDPQPRYPWVSY